MPFRTLQHPFLSPDHISSLCSQKPPLDPYYNACFSVYGSLDWCLLQLTKQSILNHFLLLQAIHAII